MSSKRAFAVTGISGLCSLQGRLGGFRRNLRYGTAHKACHLVRPGAVFTPFWDKVPLNLPKYAAPAEKAVEKIFEAFLSGLKGKLDLA